MKFKLSHLILLFLVFGLIFGFSPMVSAASDSCVLDIDDFTLNNVTGILYTQSSHDDDDDYDGNYVVQVYTLGDNLVATSDDVYAVDEGVTAHNNVTIPSEGSYKFRARIFVSERYIADGFFYSDYSYVTYAVTGGGAEGADLLIGTPTILDYAEHNTTHSIVYVGAQIGYNVTYWQSGGINYSFKVRIQADAPTQDEVTYGWFNITEGMYWNEGYIYVNKYYDYDISVYGTIFENESSPSNATYLTWSSAVFFDWQDYGDPYAREDIESSDDFAGQPMWVWQAVFALGLIMFFFMLPTLICSRMRAPPPPSSVNMSCGFLAMIGLTLFGVIPIWVCFMFALIMAIYIIQLLRR